MPRSLKSFDRKTNPARREQILDAAARVFVEKGYDAASIQDIADAVGILKGSLYYYVKTKQDFLFEIVNTQNDRIIEVARLMQALEASALANLASLVEAHIGMFFRDFARSMVYLREVRSLTGERRELIDAGAREYLGVVRSLLRAGQEEGAIDPDLDVDVQAIGIIGMLNSLASWFQPSGRLPVEQIARHYTAFIVTGVASESGLRELGMNIEEVRREIRKTGTLPSV